MENNRIMSFNNVELFEGDRVICIVGRHLRNSIIEKMPENRYDDIKIIGLKTKISNIAIIKI